MRKKIRILTMLVVVLMVLSMCYLSSAKIISKNMIPLTTNESVVAISWSPDGTKIAYVSELSSEFNSLWVMNADGTNKQHLVTFDFNLFEELFLSGYGVDWSPDGKNIAYMEYKEPDIMAIWVMNIETTKKTKLTSNAGVPLWNSDGTKIAYIGICLDSKTGYLYLGVMNADGTGKMKLASNAELPSLSPDGMKIAYGHKGRNYEQEIWTINVDGTENTRLVSNATYPQWSPDGTKIAYLSYSYGLQNSSIWVMNADGTGKTKLAIISKSMHFQICSLCSWSPDSTKIAYGSTDGSLRVVSVDGTGEILITPDFLLYSWSPDGRRIAYGSKRSDKRVDLKVMNADGTEDILLESRAGIPKWSPDGTRIAYTSIIYTLIPGEYYGKYNIGDIWMMTLGEIEPTPTPTLPTSTTIPLPTLTMTPIHEEEPFLSSKKRRVPGFEVVFAVSGLLAVAYLIRRKEAIKRR